MIVLRTEVDIEDHVKEKISLFCNVPKETVVQELDADILYEVPLNLKAQGLDDYVCKHFGIEAPEADMTEWESLIDTVRNLDGEVYIALVGKYVALHDAYLSVVEALKHAGYHFGKKVKIKWIDSEKVTGYVHEILKMLMVF